jgi:hypothetical protein
MRKWSRGRNKDCYGKRGKGNKGMSPDADTNWLPLHLVQDNFHITSGAASHNTFKSYS